MTISLIEDGRALTDDELAHVRDSITLRGEVAAARYYGIARSTLARALARLPLSRGSVALVRLKIGEQKSNGSTPQV